MIVGMVWLLDISVALVKNYSLFILFTFFKWKRLIAFPYIKSDKGVIFVYTNIFRLIRNNYWQNYNIVL